jgi:superfamily II DNA or RNA helicase
MTKVRKLFDQGKSALLTQDFEQAIEDFENSLHLALQDHTITTQETANLRYFIAIAKLGHLLWNLAKFGRPNAATNEQFKERLNAWNNQLIEVKDALDIATRFNKDHPGLQYAQKLIEPIQSSSISELTANPAKSAFFLTTLNHFYLHHLSGLLLTRELNKLDHPDSEDHFNPVTISLWTKGKDFFKKTSWPDKARFLLNTVDSNTAFFSDANIRVLYQIFDEAGDYDLKNESLFRSLGKQLFSPLTSLCSTYVSAKEHNIWNNYRHFARSKDIDYITAIRSISDNEMEHVETFITSFKHDAVMTASLRNDFINILTGKSDNKSLIKRIFNSLSTSTAVNTTKVKILEMLIQRFELTNIDPHNIATCTAELKKLIKIEKIEKSIRDISIYSELFEFLPQKPREFRAALNLIQETKDYLGDDAFSKLVTRILAYPSLRSKLLTILNAAVEIGKDYLHELLILIDEQHDNWDKLKNGIADAVSIAHYRKYPEKSLDDVMKSFISGSVDGDVEFPLSYDEAEQLRKQYERIKAFGEKLIQEKNDNPTSPAHQLPAKLRAVQEKLNACSQTLASIKPEHPQYQQLLAEQDDLKLQLLAVIRLFVEKHLHIFPYNLQMINLLALTSEPKRLAQIKTGEGKSALIAMLAAYQALQGHTVDVITSTRDLAERDAEKYKKFYQDLGLSVGCTKEQDHSSKTFEPAIVYGIVHDFEFAYIREEIGVPDTGRGKRSYDVAIVDEVDSMLIDMQRHEAILSGGSDEKSAKYPLEVYPIIWEWYTATTSKEHTPDNLIALLKVKQNIVVDIDQANRWLNGANQASKMQKMKDYLIIPAPDGNDKKSLQIKIVDFKNTGQVSQNSRWKNGTHAFLEVKNNLKVRPETCTIGAINHIEFFRKYPTLLGVTGTLGSLTTRMTLESLYGVSYYDSPSYQPSKKKLVAHCVENDTKTQHKKIKTIVDDMIQQGRPALIICETIQESEELYLYLKTHKIQQLHLYNSIQEENAETVIALAGTPGAITIATNLAGRGTDIVPSHSAEEHGGLHVMMTFPAINLRVERQAFGRTGRQGRQGTYQYVLRKDQLSEEAASCDTIEEMFERIEQERQTDEYEFSLFSNRCFEFQHHLFNLQSLFFMLPESIKQAQKDTWANLRDDIQNLSEKMIRNLTSLSDYKFETTSDDPEPAYETIYLKNINGFVAYSVNSPLGETERNIVTNIPATEPFVITDDLKIKLLSITALMGHTNSDLFSESYKILGQMCRLFFEFWEKQIGPYVSAKNINLETPYHFARNKNFTEILALFDRYYPELKKQASQTSIARNEKTSPVISFFGNLARKLPNALQLNARSSAEDKAAEDGRSFSAMFSLHNMGKPKS